VNRSEAEMGRLTHFQSCGQNVPILFPPSSGTVLLFLQWGKKTTDYTDFTDFLVWILSPFATSE
jgi:hypothetical protein